tara:strand:+ start:499 stop:615 length:117 start_codon:yes stop_codon:yes gene_type:complete
MRTNEEKEELIKIKEKLKLIPNNIPISGDDLDEIYPND